MISNEFILARSYLYSVEDVIQLKTLNLDHQEINQALNKYKDMAEVYQPEKGDKGRYVLDLVGSDTANANASLADSITHEMAFTDDTTFLETMASLREFIHKFDYGRAHALYLKSGGFFPPHRDGIIFPHLDKECFRILITVDGCTEDEFCFVVGDKVEKLENGRAYFINTLKKHYAFSFKDNCKFIILNMHVSLKNVHTLSEYITK